MKTAELWNAKNKKGYRVMQRNGWQADVLGSARGTTTLCRVYGFETECGSIYTSDIIAYKDKATGEWKHDLEFTPAQIKCREMVRSMGW